MKHLPILFLLLSAVAAHAQQTFNPPAGVDYSLLSTAPATAVGSVSYQWYRDGEAIAGATGESYTVPAAEAYGLEVEFKRQAVAAGSCSGARQVFSNTVTVTFGEGGLAPVPCNLTVNGVCWADANVDEYQTFAARPDMYTRYYQWNRATAYSATDPLTPAWNATANTSATWEVNPCPEGWQLPTSNDLIALDVAGGGTGGNNNLGSTWVGANEKGNAVAGRFYGPNHKTCRLDGSMADCVFFPASGYRSNSGGTLNSQGSVGYYWASTQDVSNVGNGYYLLFGSNNGNSSNVNNKAFGYSVRCVKK